jgi:penicillin amidase
MGSQPAAWVWGRMHPFVARHRLHSSPVGRLLSLGPAPAGGGPDTLNRGDFDVARGFRQKLGPAMRFIAAARNRDQAGTVLPGGQSGSRLSPHYDDQLPLFLKGRLKPAPVSRDKIEVALVERLVPRQSR